MMTKWWGGGVGIHVCLWKWLNGQWPVSRLFLWPVWPVSLGVRESVPPPLGLPAYHQCGVRRNAWKTLPMSV